MLPDIAFLVLVNLIGVFFEVSYRLLCVSRCSQTCYNNDLELILLNAGIIGVCYFAQFMQCRGSNGGALCMSVSNIPLSHSSRLGLTHILNVMHNLTIAQPKSLSLQPTCFSFFYHKMYLLFHSL